MQYSPAILLAPYYGVASDGSRRGWNPEFVEGIQRAEYPQYVWDVLPVGGGENGSIMRVDHILPVGADPANWKLTDYLLRDDALNILSTGLALPAVRNQQIVGRVRDLGLQLLRRSSPGLLARWA